MSGNSMLSPESIRSCNWSMSVHLLTRLLSLQFHVEITALVRKVIPLLVNHVKLFHNLSGLGHLLHFDQFEHTTPIEFLS